MKYELNRPLDYSNEALLIEIRRVASLIDKPLSRKLFDENSKYNSCAIFKRFGSWRNALIKAGLDKENLSIKNYGLTKDELIEEIKRISKILGTECFSEKDFTNASGYNRSIFSRKFGKFRIIMNDIGFTTPQKGRKYTDKERFENLLNVWTFYGRQPSYAEMNIEPSKVGAKTYVIRWGSWKKALLAFLEKVNSNNEKDDVIIENILENNFKNNIKPKINPKEGRREIPIGLRFDILKKDNYKCKICGRSPSSTIGIELHVDHIIPFSKGGKTVENNLRTLCNQCNIGKSDKI
jgi:hypothetical protein